MSFDARLYNEPRMLRTRPHLFASGIDELTFDFRLSSNPREVRHEHGQAWTSWSDGWSIEATDDLTRTRGTFSLSDETRQWLSERATETANATDIAKGAAFLRLTRRRAVVVSETGEEQRSESLLISFGSSPEAMRVVTASTRALEVPDALPPGIVIGDVSSLPWVFRNGSGAVLLHEAVGHASEIGLSSVPWPRSLRVFDDPSAVAIGTVAVDDIGGRPERRDLTAGESPDAMRRWTFRDLPLRRMTNLVVESDERLEELPQRRVEIVNISGGAFDPLSDVVSLRVNEAYAVDGSRVRIAPFQCRVTRRDLSSVIVGAHGPSQSYDGVICSSEGTALPVGSISPDLVLARGLDE